MRRRGAVAVVFVAAELLIIAAKADCIVMNSTLAFGNYNPVSGSPTFANASVTVKCGAIISTNATVPYTLLLSAGNSGSTTSRNMSGPVPLPYNLYTDSTYTTVWDNTTGVPGSVMITGLLGLPILTYGVATVTVYGRILAQQAVTSGSYVDALVMTVSF